MDSNSFMKTIKLPKNVTITYQNHRLTLSGIHGTTYLPIHTNLRITIEKTYLSLTLVKATPAHKKYLGLYHSLIQTHLKGITQKFKLPLLLKGIGYKVQKIGDTLWFKLGYSHPIAMAIPKDMDVFLVTPHQMTLYGFNWAQVTQFASQIQKLKPIEPYKGKGILLKNEKILRKEGKKNKK